MTNTILTTNYEDLTAFMTNAQILRYYALVENSCQRTIFAGEEYTCFPNENWKYASEATFYSEEITKADFDIFMFGVINRLQELSSGLDLEITYNSNTVHESADEYCCGSDEPTQFYFDFEVLYDDKSVYDRFVSAAFKKLDNSMYILGFAKCRDLD